MALPVTIELARLQLNLGPAEGEDEEINGFIDDAAAWVERVTGHILEARDVTEQFTGLHRLELRAWPILPTAVPAVAYADATGTPIGIAGARIDISRRPARVMPALGGYWPALPTGTLTTVTLRAGYEDPADVPRDLRRAMLILISGYDNDREGGDIFMKSEASARRLCDRHRLRRI